MRAEAKSLEELIEDLARVEPAVAAKVRELGAAKFAHVLQRGFEAFRVALSRAFDTIQAIGTSLAKIPGIEKWITSLQAERRYARGQRRKKPRGWRAKERSRVGWAVFLEAVRISNLQRAAEADLEEREQAATVPSPPVPASEQPSFAFDQTPGTV
jgi:hypothetical protein